MPTHACGGLWVVVGERGEVASRATRRLANGFLVRTRARALTLQRDVRVCRVLASTSPRWSG
jgi:hypothetical protein